MELAVSAAEGQGIAKHWTALMRAAPSCGTDSSKGRITAPIPRQIPFTPMGRAVTDGSPSREYVAMRTLYAELMMGSLRLLLLQNRELDWFDTALESDTNPYLWRICDKWCDEQANVKRGSAVEMVTMLSALSNDPTTRTATIWRLLLQTISSPAVWTEALESICLAVGRAVNHISAALQDASGPLQKIQLACEECYALRAYVCVLPFRVVECPFTMSKDKELADSPLQLRADIQWFQLDSRRTEAQDVLHLSAQEWAYNMGMEEALARCKAQRTGLDSVVIVNRDRLSAPTSSAGSKKSKLPPETTEEYPKRLKATSQVEPRDATTRNLAVTYTVADSARLTKSVIVTAGTTGVSPWPPAPTNNREPLTGGHSFDDRAISDRRYKSDESHAADWDRKPTTEFVSVAGSRFTREEKSLTRRRGESRSKDVTTIICTSRRAVPVIGRDSKGDREQLCPELLQLPVGWKYESITPPPLDEEMKAYWSARLHGSRPRGRQTQTQRSSLARMQTLPRDDGGFEPMVIHWGDEHILNAVGIAADVHITLYARVIMYPINAISPIAVFATHAIPTELVDNSCRDIPTQHVNPMAVALYAFMSDILEYPEEEDPGRAFARMMNTVIRVYDVMKADISCRAVVGEWYKRAFESFSPIVRFRTLQSFVPVTTGMGALPRRHQDVALVRRFPYMGSPVSSDRDAEMFYIVPELNTWAPFTVGALRAVQMLPRPYDWLSLVATGKANSVAQGVYRAAAPRTDDRRRNYEGDARDYIGLREHSSMQAAIKDECDSIYQDAVKLLQQDSSLTSQQWVSYRKTLMPKENTGLMDAEEAYFMYKNAEQACSKPKATSFLRSRPLEVSNDVAKAHQVRQRMQLEYTRMDQVLTTPATQGSPFLISRDAEVGMNRRESLQHYEDYLAIRRHIEEDRRQPTRVVPLGGYTRAPTSVSRYGGVTRRRIAASSSSGSERWVGELPRGEVVVEGERGSQGESTPE